MNTKLSIVFTIFFAFVLLAPSSFSNAFAEKNFVCSEGKVLVYRINSDKYACLNPSSASQWYDKGIAEPVEQIVSSEQKKNQQPTLEISAEFPFESHYVDVLGSKMHYIDEGQSDEDVILFIHGNPESVYVWRNIIPYVSDDTRVVAVDLIGMGKSDKPDIDYRFVDHARYLDGFIKELDLKNVTLVIHDWGSALGFNYAMNNEDNIKGIAFMEAILMPMTWEQFPPEAKEMFENFRTPGVGEEMIMNQNFFIEQVLPFGTVRELSEEEMNQYREPYPTPESRKPIWVWPNEIPIDGQPADVHEIVVKYNQWLQETEIPKLLFHATDGALADDSIVKWSKQNLKNLQTVDIGQGIHFVQEDNPHKIGESISDWYQTLESAKTYLPLPDHAKFPLIDMEIGYETQEIGDGVYWLKGPTHHTMFLTTGQGVVAVDAPAGLEDHYLNAIAEVTSEPITHLIYSHSHKDHIGGASIFSDVEIIAHEETAKKLQRMNDPNRPLPTVTFDDSYTLEIGNKVIQLDYHGPVHSAGNIFIYIPDEKVLMLVDIIYPDWSPFLYFADAESISDYIDAHDKILEYDFEKMISGHLKLVNRDHVLQQQEIVVDILQFAGDGMQQSEFRSLFKSLPTSDNLPAAFYSAFEIGANYCEEKMVEKWNGKVGGLDVFTHDQCKKMMYYHLHE